MEQKTRSEALAAGESQYFTGKPCKADHTTYRYTASGACAGCVAAASYASRSMVAPAAPRVSADGTLTTRRDIIANLTEINLRAYPGDIETLKAVALAHAMTRWPGVTMDEVAIKAKPGDAVGGTALYRVRVPGENVDDMRKLANTLLNNHTVDLSSFHAGQARAAAALVGADAPAAGDWTFK